MITCAVIDDEPWAVALLEDYISKIPFLEWKCSNTNPINGLAQLQKEKVDLVFLDIQMPELTGLQLAKILGSQCQVIFTTAYSDYALKGYDLDVVDYLLKPISFERFFQSALKAQRIILPATTEAKSETVNFPTNTLLSDFIFVKTDRKIVKVDLSDILFIEGVKDYIAIYTNKEKLLVLENLKTFEQKLPSSNFCRIHKSYIVNIGAIDSMERNRIFLKEHVIPIGESYRDVFQSTLANRQLGR